MTCAGLCKIIAIPSLGIASFVAHRWPQVPPPSHLACKSLLVQVDQVHLSTHHFQSLGLEIWNTRELWQKSLHCWCGWMESSEFALLVTFLFLTFYAYCVFSQGLDWVNVCIALEESPLCQYKKSWIRPCCIRMIGPHVTLPPDPTSRSFFRAGPIWGWLGLLHFLSPAWWARDEKGQRDLSMVVN